MRAIFHYLLGRLCVALAVGAPGARAATPALGSSPQVQGGPIAFGATYTGRLDGPASSTVNSYLVNTTSPVTRVRVTLHNTTSPADAAYNEAREEVDLLDGDGTGHAPGARPARALPGATTTLSYTLRSTGAHYLSISRAGYGHPCTGQSYPGCSTSGSGAPPTVNDADWYLVHTAQPVMEVQVRLANTGSGDVGPRCATIRRPTA